MPVQLEQIKQLDPQSIEGLRKVYADQLPAEDVDNWLRQQLDSGKLLFAGRFNGAILGAVWAEPGANDWRLQKLCVRSVTRRRGVARQLLTLLLGAAAKRRFSVSCDHSCLPLSALLNDLGFKSESDNPRLWIKPCQ